MAKAFTEQPLGARVFSGYSPGTDIPSPPVQIADVQFRITGLRWPESVVRAVLPRELTPASTLTGVAYVFGSARPGPVSPFECGFLAIEVLGFDSPDGSPAHYVVAGHIAGRAGEMVRRDLNANFSDGYARWFNDGDTMWGITGPAGHESVRMGLRPIAGAVVAEAAGIHNFLGTDPHGRGINLYSVAFTGDVFYSTPVSLDVLSDATTRMGQMQPAELLWALGCNNMTITYGAPRLISEMAEIVRESARTLLLEVFSQLGKAAAIVAADSRLLLLNPQAEVLWAEQPLGRRASIQLHRSGDQGALDQLVKSAARGRGGMLDLSPIAVERPDGRPILIQAMPVDQAVAGQAAALLLFSDPASPQAASPVRALQLLGLTPAEARIASLVGAGRSPREAAGTLRLTVNTVRSTLKVAYEKLGITRQSELAKIVVRLAG